MKEGRYIKASEGRISQLNWERIFSRNLLKPNTFSRFYSQLYSLLGEPAGISYEGFSYMIKDQLTGVFFEAALTGFGPGYLGNPQIEKIKEVVAEFDQYLESLALKDCRIEIQNDFGTLILGVKNGIPFEEEILEEE